MFSTLPPSSFTSPTASFLDRSAAASSPDCLSPDALMYNFNFSPSAAVSSPFNYHANQDGHHYQTVSPSHASAYLHGMTPFMYGAPPTIGPPHHKRLRSDRDAEPTTHRRNLDHHDEEENDDDDRRGCDSSASEDIVASRRHRRKRHHAASEGGGSETVPVYISKDEYRKMKNRQSAARSREKSLAKVRVLERRVAELEQENDYLLELLASVGSIKPAHTGRLPTVSAADKDQESDQEEAETAADELMDRVASHCADALYDGVEWCL